MARFLSSIQLAMTYPATISPTNVSCQRNDKHAIHDHPEDDLHYAWDMKRRYFTQNEFLVTIRFVFVIDVWFWCFHVNGKIICGFSFPSIQTSQFKDVHTHNYPTVLVQPRLLTNTNNIPPIIPYILARINCNNQESFSCQQLWTQDRDNYYLVLSRAIVSPNRQLTKILKQLILLHSASHLVYHHGSIETPLPLKHHSFKSTDAALHVQSSLQQR